MTRDVRVSWALSDESLQNGNTPRDLVYESDAILVLLPETQDPTGADRDAGVSNRLQSVESIIVCPRRDYLVFSEKRKEKVGEQTSG